jgi:nucleoside-diphosphate-sugar epimerase
MKTYWYKKRVLITGAGGFIGSHLYRELTRRGATVTALSHKNIDLTNKDEIKRAITNETIIIHAAAVDGGKDFKIQNANIIYKNNINMTANLLEVLENNKIEKFLYISSAEIYFGTPKNNPIKEDDLILFPPTKPDFFYAWSKIICEKMCISYAYYHHIKIIIVRPANIYGRDDNNDKGRLVPKLIHALKYTKGKVVLSGDGNQIRSFLFIDDYINNLISLLEKSDGGIFNIAGGKNILIKNFVKLFAKRYHRKIVFEKNNINKPNTFVLNLSKIKKTIPYYFDTSYEDIINTIL